jgi:iron complex outermembrane receptor protein
MEGSVNVEGGNYNYLSTKFMLNVPVIENKFFAKIGGKISRRDGYVTNLYNNKDMNGEDIIGGRLQFRYLASDELEFLLSLDAFQNTMDPRTDAMANDGSNNNPRELSHDAEEFDYLDLYGTALTVDYRFLSGHSLKSISAFRWNNNWSSFDIDLSPLFVAISGWSDTTRLFTQEFRLTSPLKGLFDYVAGLYYFYQNTTKNNSFFTGPEYPLIPDNTVHSNAIVKTNSFAGYFNGNLHLIKNLTLTAGLRYTYEYRKVQFDQINDPSTIFYIDVDNYTDTYSEGVLSPKLGLNFSLSPNVFLYGFVAQGFTSGGWNVSYITTFEHIKFLPEYATSFELGLKTNLLNNRIVANLSAFITKLRDYQVSHVFFTEDSVWRGSFENAGKVTTKGFELDISVILLKELRVNGGWGYADARFDEFKNGGGEGIDYDGNRLPWAPKNKFNISIEYQQSIGNVGSIFLFGEFVHQGNYFCLPSNNIELTFVDSHELLNARVGFHFANNLLGISVWGKNLLGELYILGYYPALFNTPSVWYGPPRTFGIEIYHNFLR